jgi:DNA (cytosine-5)-methyltransferase 1
MGNNPMGAPEVDGGMYMPWPQQVGALDCRIQAQRAQNAQSGHLLPIITHSLRARHDGSEDDTGRGTPLIASWPAEVAPTLNAAFGTKQGLEDQHALGGAGCFVLSSGQANHSIDVNCAPALTALHEAPIAFHNRQDPDVSGSVTHPLAAKDNGLGVAMAVPIDLRNAKRDPEKHDAVNRQGVGVAKDGDPAHTVTTACVHGVATAMQVRRLTPVECERLQGFPDGYTDIKPRGKDTPDGPRYKALGNSMAVPVMRWIGERVNLVDSLKRSR